MPDMALSRKISDLGLQDFRTFRVPRWGQRTKLHVASGSSFVLAITLLGLGISSLSNMERDSTTCDIQNASGAERSFSIDIRLGSQLSYVGARALDIFWDIVVGQGGRFLQAWLLYKVSCDALVFLMERSCVPYDLYASLTLSPGSLESLYSIAKLLRRRRGYETGLTAVWLFWSTVHVLAYPTLWSAATGYVNPTEWNYRMPDNSLINLQSDNLTFCYTCVDCGRIPVPELKDNMLLQSDPLGKLFPSRFSIDKIGFGYSQYYPYDEDYGVYTQDHGNLLGVAECTVSSTFNLAQSLLTSMRTLGLQGILSLGRMNFPVTTNL